jgi:hypothetical protein
MRLSDVLSRAPDSTPVQVEGFLAGRPLKWGKHKKASVGKVFLNFHCRQCDDQRTFVSGDELYCLGLGDETISVDVTLRCPACQTSVEAWFLVRGESDLAGTAPTVRLERYTEHLRNNADRVGPTKGQYGDLIRRAQLAYEAQLGAGSMIYLRKILESITLEVARLAAIETRTAKGRRVPFKDLLRAVDEERNIIPKRFSRNGYRLFSDLSAAIHGDASEDDALQKYEPCLQLVSGVVEEVNRDHQFAKAIETLGWDVENSTEMA